MSVAGSPIGHLQVLSVNSMSEIFFAFISTFRRFFTVSSLKSDTTLSLLSLERVSFPNEVADLFLSPVISGKSRGSFSFCGRPLFLTSLSIFLVAAPS